MELFPGRSEGWVAYNLNTAPLLSECYQSNMAWGASRFIFQRFLNSGSRSIQQR
jgi:hypothetical protein